MAVPQDIRAVPRPVNTIVDDSGRDGPKRFAVRQRASSKYVPGGNPQPRNGRVIGHIINHRYVPVSSPMASEDADMLSYGASALVKAVTGDLFSNLLDVFDSGEAYAIMSMATLKVVKPRITANRMSTHYRRTFVCRDYPGAALSKNSITDLCRRLDRTAGGASASTSCGFHRWQQTTI